MIQREDNVCGLSCSNSFGILQQIAVRTEHIHIEKNHVDDGRRGRNVSLPKQLKDDFIMEY